MSGNWQRADPDALTWLHSIANDLDDAGIGVGPMPDKVFVLHPLSERVDGLPMDDGRELFVLEGGDGPLPSAQDPDATEPPERIVRWHEYAQRRNIPMFVPPGYASLRDALPGVWEDDYVSPPGEGASYDSMTQQALFDILLRHTDTRGAAGTAYFFSFWVGDPGSKGRLTNVLHGPLASRTSNSQDPLIAALSATARSSSRVERSHTARPYDCGGHDHRDADLRARVTHFQRPTRPVEGRPGWAHLDGSLRSRNRSAGKGVSPAATPKARCRRGR